MSRYRLAAAALLALVLPGCVPGGEVTIAFDDARFNDKIRGDFGPHVPEDMRADPKFGFFRREGEPALVSEIFPYSPTAYGDSISGRLVQSPCLFLGQPPFHAGTTDELRIGWELIGNIDRSADELLEDNFQEGYEEVGLCTFSSPVNRLLFERPGASLNKSALACGHEHIEFAATLNDDKPEENANIPSTCIVAHDWPEVVVEAFSPSRPDADALCPGAATGTSAHFSDNPVGVAGSRSVCGFPAMAVEPTADTSYRLTLQAGHSFAPANPERWLSPTVMFVDGFRSVVRPLTPGATANVFRWKTPVSAHGDEDKQWGENYMPTVLVERVEILSRDGRGGEWIETPVGEKLTIGIPRAAGSDAVVTCTGRVHDGSFSFEIPSDCGFQDDQQLRALTPTYAAVNIGDQRAPVTRPIEWSVGVENLSGPHAFIRFSLRVQASAQGALRISPLWDVGPLQVDNWKQAALILRNENGPELEVRTVAFGPTSAHPQDFSFVVAGDPVDVPLPIEAVPSGSGKTLRWAADASDAPIVTYRDDGATVDVTLGQPARGSGTETLSIYRQAARLVGNVLLRDDPADTLAPAAPAWPRPFTIPAFAERQTPFLLGPNESVKIVVTARPTATGVRTANIRVEAVPIGDPRRAVQVISQLSVTALSGPQLRGIPHMLLMGSGAYRDDTRFAMIENVGNFDLRLTRLVIVGRNASRFAIATSGAGRPPAVPFTLAPSGYQDIQILYTPQCDGTYTPPYDHEAALRVESNGGTWQLPMYGASQPFCP